MTDRSDITSNLQGLTDRPEVLVGGAFAGGLLLAIVLRALGRG